MMLVFYVLLIVMLIADVEAINIKVIDGDSLFINNKEVRLEGIDAPEYNQQCFDVTNKLYDCGKYAYEYLKSIVKDDVECQYITKDKYKRSVAICYSQGVCLNEQMVKQGWAVAYDRYTKDYVDEEVEAKENKRGIWQGRFMRPELYRVLHND